MGIMVEGMSIRAITLLTGVGKNTVAKFERSHSVATSMTFDVF